jgi:hypothetical protein
MAYHRPISRGCSAMRAITMKNIDEKSNVMAFAVQTRRLSPAALFLALFWHHGPGFVIVGTNDCFE